MTPATAPAIWWLRRDLRLGDNPALRAAIAEGNSVLPLFVLDPVLLDRAGTARRAWLMAALHAMDTQLRDTGGPGLSVVRGRPDAAVTAVANDSGARQVHTAADFAPYGRRRDSEVATALERVGVAMVATGSPYAVAPGTLRNQTGHPFQVFSPYHRAWLAHGVHDPAPGVGNVAWTEAENRVELPPAADELGAQVGERVALQAWRDFLDRDPTGVAGYAKQHDFPGIDATSRLSIALRWGHIHPRTVLADLRPRRSKGALALARQIAWRDFFADVLYHRPDAVHQPIKPEYARMPTDEPETDGTAATRFEAWKQGRTGFPLVDAGMRQLLAEGWMHNRVRMVVASFLIKDLHIGWWHGAGWFMDRLRDGDIAQNQLNWQWVAGCGTDAAPFFRVFNPVTQGEKFDPDGTYIRRWVPELADVVAEHLHQPWHDPAGLPDGYPPPIVDHAAERKEALDRYAIVRGG